MVQIFVEGREDQELVEALLADLGKASRATVSLAGGWTTLDKVQNSLRITTDGGGTNLIVFDADRAPEGGVGQRRAQIAARLAELRLEANVFLLPDDASDGRVEDLMVGMVPDRHRPVLDCFGLFQACLERLDHPDPEQAYVVDLDKTRTYSYVHAMPLTASQKEIRNHPKKSAKFFDDGGIWDLNAPAVGPLRAFLDRHVL